MIRVGIVGCGRILAAHLRGFRLLKEAGFTDFAITSLCARRESDARMYVERGKGPPQRPATSDIDGDPLAITDEYLSDFQDVSRMSVEGDFRALIARRDVDAVMDLTTHAMHHPIGMEAFRHKKHLLTQKPLAHSVFAARQMCEAADDAGVTFGVFECFRFLPLTRALEWLFHRGPGGRLQMILVGYVGAWWAPDQIVAHTPWRHRKGEGGGITLDLGVHFLDQMRVVAGRPLMVTGHTSIVEPIRVRRSPTGEIFEQVACDADDTVFATIDFDNGVVANLAASWAGAVAPTLAGSGIVYYGSAARVDGDTIQLPGQPSEDLVARYEREAPRAELDRAFPLGLKDWFALGQLDWLQAIQKGTLPEANGAEGLADLAAAMAILESSVSGRRVQVDEVLSGRLHKYQRPFDAILGFE